MTNHIDYSSFHGQQGIKDQCLAALETATEFIPFTHYSRHLKLGIPDRLCHLMDAICEGLPGSLDIRFQIDAIKAIPVGSDLRAVAKKFAIWLLIDDSDGLITKVSDNHHKELIKELGGHIAKEIEYNLTPLRRAAITFEVAEDVFHKAYKALRSAEALSVFFIDRYIVYPPRYIGAALSDYPSPLSIPLHDSWDDTEKYIAFSIALIDILNGIEAP